MIGRGFLNIFFRVLGPLSPFYALLPCARERLDLTENGMWHPAICLSQAEGEEEQVTKREDAGCCAVKSAG